MGDSVNRDKEPDFDVAFYVVAFIDILGQRDALRHLDDFPDEGDPQAREEFIQKLKDTMGAVMSLSDTLHTYFKAEQSAAADRIQVQNPQQREELERLRNHDLRLQRYGDGIVAFTSLAGGKDAFPASRVWSVLNACASVMALFLSLGKPIRGGIDVGIGAEIFPGELYGSCVARAYELECNVASPTGF
jgi:hypothetical protein